MLREKFQVKEKVRGMLYGENDTSELDLYRVVKEMIWNSINHSCIDSPSSEKTVNLPLLQNLLNEIQLNIDLSIYRESQEN